MVYIDRSVRDDKKETTTNDRRWKIVFANGTASGRGGGGGRRSHSGGNRNDVFYFIFILIIIRCGSISLMSERHQIIIWPDLYVILFDVSSMSNQPIPVHQSDILQAEAILTSDRRTGSNPQTSAV